MSEKFGHSNAKTQKTGHSYTLNSLLKKGVYKYLAALKKGGVRAYIRTMSYIVISENVVRGNQKLCNDRLTMPP